MLILCPTFSKQYFAAAVLWIYSLFARFEAPNEQFSAGVQIFCQKCTISCPVFCVQIIFETTFFTNPQKGQFSLAEKIL